MSTEAATEFTSVATEFSTEIETEIVTVEEATTEISSIPTSEATTEGFTTGKEYDIITRCSYNSLSGIGHSSIFTSAAIQLCLVRMLSDSSVYFLIGPEKI